MAGSGMTRNIGAELVARLKHMNDILTDYREWRDKQPVRVSTHSDRCHMWHERCMIHRLADALERATLADEEREAISRVYDLLCDRSRELQSATRLDEARPLIQWAKTLQGLWERLSGSAAISGAGKSAPAANTPLTLTDEEREAVEWAIDKTARTYDDPEGGPIKRESLRTLLERTR